MENITLTQIQFDRAVFKIEGEFSGFNIDMLYFRDALTKKTIPFDIDEITENKFRGSVLVFGCNEGQPLTTGHWHIGAFNSKGEFIRAGVSDDLYDKIYLFKHSDVVIDFVINKSENNYFHAFSKLNEENYKFYLKVLYEIPEKDNRILPMWIRNIKRRHRTRMRLIRNKAFRGLFKICGAVVPKNGRRVLFTSDSRTEIGGNEKYVYDRMVELGMDKKYDIHFMYKSNIKEYRSFKDKFLFTYYLATADYIFMDDFQPEIYKNDYDENVKIIQLWHACGAFKTVGFERLRAKGAPAFNTRVHKCYTHVPVSSELAAAHNSEAFALSRDKFYSVGVPRTDIFFDEDYKKQTVEKMYEEFPVAKTAKKVILYAPTFRGNGAKTAYFPIHMLNYRKIGEYLKKTGSIMIIKMHPFVSNTVKIPDEYKDVFVDATEYREVNDILFITDLLITDYSSVIYEMSLLRKPMMFYAFDLESYVSERGFYEPYEKIVPGKIVYNIQELLKALEEEDFESEKLDEFIKRNFTYTDGKSTDRVIELVFGKENLM